MARTPEQTIFKQGSTTYYFSSKFFPKKVREDVFRLYSFVRVADDYVDHRPPQPKKLLALESAFTQAITNHAYDATALAWDDTDTRVIKNIVRLCHKYKFDPAWVDAFFTAMKQDIDPPRYHTLDDSLKYVYGSAEVIGLMMAKILNLPEESYEFARLQGRAMQWINFTRDIQEDNQLGRRYIPAEDLKKYHLSSLTREAAEANPTGFKKCIRLQLKRYHAWQAEAEQGFAYIPRSLRIPLKTAVDMYNWTAHEIAENPMIVFDRQVKPRKHQVVRTGLKHMFKK